MFIFPLLPKRCQICDSCHFPEGSARNLPRACRRDISPTLYFDWVFFTALPFREATSTSASCQALLLNHVISQKHRKNSHVHPPTHNTMDGGNKLKTIARHTLLFLFPWVGVACGVKGDRLRVLIVGLLLALLWHVGIVNAAFFADRGIYFPLLEGSKIPSSIALSVKLSTCL